MRAVRAVCGCQFAVWLFVCLCFVLNGVRPLGGGGALAPAFPAFVRCPRGCCGALAPALRAVSASRFPPPPFGFAPPWLAVRGSRRGWSSPRSACAMRRLARPSSRQPRPRSVRSRFAGSPVRARARPPRASVLFVCLSLVCAFVGHPAGCASVRGVSFVLVSSASLSLCLCVV